jgi:hypothetical protein
VQKIPYVLRNGENVEPQLLEDAILGGSGGLVEHVMLTGQRSEEISCMVLKINFGNGTHLGMVNLGTPLARTLITGTANALESIYAMKRIVR